MFYNYSMQYSCAETERSSEIGSPLNFLTAADFSTPVIIHRVCESPRFQRFPQM